MAKQPKPQHAGECPGCFRKSVGCSSPDCPMIMLTKLRADRDFAATHGNHAEAMILNDRIDDLKSGLTSKTVERVTQQFESGLARKRFYAHQLCQCPSCKGRGYTNPAFNCRWCEGTGVVSEEDAVAFGPDDS